MSRNLLIGEQLGDDGEPSRTWLHIGGRAADAVVLDDNGRVTPIPVRAVALVMRRYGRELDPGVAADGDSTRHAIGARHAIGVLGTLERLRFRAGVDADGRDYLVWREPDRPPLAALSIQIAAALRFLARSNREEQP